MDQSVSCAKIQTAFLAVICITFSMVLSRKPCYSPHQLFLSIQKHFLSKRKKDAQFAMDTHIISKYIELNIENVQCTKF